MPKLKHCQCLALRFAFGGVSSPASILHFGRFDRINRSLIHFRFQGLDFQRQALEFGHLARQKAHRETGFFSYADGGEQVGVSQLVRAFLKALHLDEALAQQGLQAIVGFTQTDSQRIGQIALAEVRVGL
jgi:hypothetical protein